MKLWILWLSSFSFIYLSFLAFHFLPFTISLFLYFLDLFSVPLCSVLFFLSYLPPIFSIYYIIFQFLFCFLSFIPFRIFIKFLLSKLVWFLFIFVRLNLFFSSVEIITRIQIFSSHSKSYFPLTFWTYLFLYLQNNLKIDRPSSSSSSSSLLNPKECNYHIVCAKNLRTLNQGNYCCSEFDL